MNAKDTRLNRPLSAAAPIRAMSEAGTAPPDAPLLAALLERVAQTHDRAAFAALFKHFAPRVKAFLRRGGLQANEAEEVTQEVMLLLWRKAAQFDPARASAATWVFAITRNVRVDYVRRRRDLPAAPEAEAPLLASSAESQILTTERDARLRAALAALSPEQRKIVQLSFFAESPHPAIARALDLPLGTVKSRIRLAMGKLRALLEETP